MGVRHLSAAHLKRWASTAVLPWRFIKVVIFKMNESKIDILFLLSPELFPMIYKDVESGIYVAEIIMPPSGEASKQAQVLVDSNALNAISATDLRLIQRMSYWAQAGTTIALNPAFAFAEQVLSNEANAEAKVEDWTRKLSPSGIFPKDYASTFYPYILERKNGIQEQVSVIFCYLALFEHWSTEFRLRDDALQKWIDFFKEDVPRLKVLYFLGGLFIISMRDESLRLRGATDSVAAWRMSICDDRSKEKQDYARRLRNRAFDLLFFLLAPVLTFASAGGVDSRVLLATEDRFLGEFICRIFQWIDAKADRQWLLRMCSEQFVSKRGDASINAIQTLIEGESVARSYKNIPGESQKKLRRLADLTLQMLPPPRALELRNALEAFGHPL